MHKLLATVAALREEVATAMQLGTTRACRGALSPPHALQLKKSSLGGSGQRNSRTARWLGVHPPPHIACLAPD